MPQVFGVAKEITLLGYVLRTFLVLGIMFSMGRLISKRAVTQLTTYDFVFIWILGALSVAPLLDGRVSFTYTLVPLHALFFWHTLISVLSKYSKPFSHIFTGKPVILIDKGQLIRKNLKKHFINIDLLLTQLRLKDVFDIKEVAYAILEPNGHLSVLKWKGNQTVTASDLNIQTPAPSITEVLINDGKLLKDKLISRGLTEEWLQKALLGYGISRYEDVFVAAVDSGNKLFVAKNTV